MYPIMNWFILLFLVFDFSDGAPQRIVGYKAKECIYADGNMDENVRVLRIDHVEFSTIKNPDERVEVKLMFSFEKPDGDCIPVFRYVFEEDPSSDFYIKLKSIEANREPVVGDACRYSSNLYLTPRTVVGNKVRELPWFLKLRILDENLWLNPCYVDFPFQVLHMFYDVEVNGFLLGGPAIGKTRLQCNLISAKNEPVVDFSGNGKGCNFGPRDQRTSYVKVLDLWKGRMRILDCFGKRSYNAEFMQWFRHPGIPDLYHQTGDYPNSPDRNITGYYDDKPKYKIDFAIIVVDYDSRPREGSPNNEWLETKTNLYSVHGTEIPSVIVVNCGETKDKKTNWCTEEQMKEARQAIRGIVQSSEVENYVTYPSENGVSLPRDGWIDQTNLRILGYLIEFVIVRRVQRCRDICTRSPLFELICRFKLLGEEWLEKGLGDLWDLDHTCDQKIGTCDVDKKHTDECLDEMIGNFEIQKPKEYACAFASFRMEPRNFILDEMTKQMGGGKPFQGFCEDTNYLLLYGTVGLVVLLVLVVLVLAISYFKKADQKKKDE